MEQTEENMIPRPSSFLCDSLDMSLLIVESRNSRHPRTHLRIWMCRFPFRMYFQFKSNWDRFFWAKSWSSHPCIRFWDQRPRTLLWRRMKWCSRSLWLRSLFVSPWRKPVSNCIIWPSLQHQSDGGTFPGHGCYKLLNLFLTEKITKAEMLWYDE